MLSEVKLGLSISLGSYWTTALDTYSAMFSFLFTATSGILGYNICNNGSLLTTSPHICLRAQLIWAILSLYVMTRAGVTPPIGGLVVLTPSVVKAVRSFCFL